ncbi:MAG: hypothetical protein GC160_27200 [Acidobacteria bacterium]|nr:hypothetical protein [Acidobacteriota bacterium]
MNCSWMQDRLAKYVEGELPWLERQLAQLHLRLCEQCFADYEKRESVNGWASWATPARPPARLEMSIRLAISREIARETRLTHWMRDLRAMAREALGPIAIRSVGVLASAVLLFGVLMPDIWRAPVKFPDDVPLTYMAEAIVKAPSVEVMGPYSGTKDVTVLAFIDMEGAMYDLEFPAELAEDVRLRSEVANALLFTEFQPATKFGRPVAGQVLINFTKTTVRG